MFFIGFIFKSKLSQIKFEKGNEIKSYIWDTKLKNRQPNRQPIKNMLPKNYVFQLVTKNVCSPSGTTKQLYGVVFFCPKSNKIIDLQAFSN